MEVKRSLVLIAAVDEPVVVVGEPGVTVVELFVPGRTVAIAAASDPGGLVAVEEGIWSPSNACTDTISTCDCSDGGENAVWRGLGIKAATTSPTATKTIVLASLPRHDLLELGGGVNSDGRGSGFGRGVGPSLGSASRGSPCSLWQVVLRRPAACHAGLPASGGGMVMIMSNCKFLLCRRLFVGGGLTVSMAARLQE